MEMKKCAAQNKLDISLFSFKREFDHRNTREYKYFEMKLKIKLPKLMLFTVEHT